MTVGRFSAEISRILLSLDVTRETVDEALDLHCDLLLTHHPFPWRERRRFDLVDPDNTLLARILAGGLNLFAVHTNLDAAPNSHATYLALQLGLIDLEPLKPAEGSPIKTEALRDVSPDATIALDLSSPGVREEPGVGLGRIGNLASPESFAQLIARFKMILNVQSLVIAGLFDQQIERVAICPGAAGDLLDRAIAAGAHLLIGAEFSHHEALRALANGMTLIEAGHFATEMPAVQILNQACQDLFRDKGVEVILAQSEQNPLSYH